MIGGPLSSGIQPVSGGQPREGWFRLLVRMLQEIAAVLTAGKHGKMVLPAVSIQSLVAASQIAPDGVTVYVKAGTITLTSVPTIPDGEEGQLICITKLDGGDLTLQDQSTLSGSNLRLATATLTIGPRSSVWLRFCSRVGEDPGSPRLDGDWIQVTPKVLVI